MSDTKKMTKGERISRAITRAEEASVELINKAEQWTVTGRTLWDLKVMRQELLKAARTYTHPRN
jgi:hypothetical protein